VSELKTADFRTYHKIQSVFKRDPENNYKSFLFGEWADESFGYLQHLPWIGTDKIDGTNTRIQVTEEGWQVGGRTPRAELAGDLLTHLEIVGERAHATGFRGTLFGEGYGPGIQKGGGDYRDDKGFILFDVLAEGNTYWLSQGEMEETGIAIAVPIVWPVYHGSLFSIIEDFKEGWDFWSLAGKIGDDGLLVKKSEGLVLRPATELRNQYGGRVITKLKFTDFT